MLHTKNVGQKGPFNKNMKTALMVGGATCCVSLALIKKFGRMNTDLPLSLSTVKAAKSDEEVSLFLLLLSNIHG